MKRIVILIVALTVASACSKQKKPVANAELAQVPFIMPAEELTEEELAQMRFALLELRRVHFALDSTELTDASTKALQDAYARLVEFPRIQLYVEGHADAQGTTEYNIGLAEDRATVVCDYLARLGMPADRLHVVSWGEEKPLKRGDGPQIHALNRRVDFALKRGDLELHVKDGQTVATR